MVIGIVLKTGGISSVGRAPAWHAGGQRFESAMLHFVFILVSHYVPVTNTQVAANQAVFLSLTSKISWLLKDKELAIACARAARANAG